MDRRGSPPADAEHDRLLRYARATPPQPSSSAAQDAPPPYIAHLRSPPRSFPPLPGTAALDPLPPLEAPGFRGGPTRFNPVALRPIQTHPRPPQHFPRIASQDDRDRPPTAAFPARLAPHPDPTPAPQPPQPTPQHPTPQQPTPQRSPAQSLAAGAPTQSPAQGTASPPQPVPGAAAPSSTSSAGPAPERAPRSSTPSASPKGAGAGTNSGGGPAPRSPPAGPGPALAPVATLIPSASTQPPPLPPRAGLLEAGSSRILQSVHSLQRMPHGAPLPHSDGLGPHRRPSPGPMLHPLQQPGSRNRTPSPAQPMRMASIGGSVHTSRISPVNSRPISPLQAHARVSSHDQQQQRDYHAAVAASRAVPEHTYGHKPLDAGPGRGAMAPLPPKGGAEAPIDVDALPSEPSPATSVRGGMGKNESGAALGAASSSRAQLPPYSTPAQHPYHIAPATTKHTTLQEQPHPQQQQQQQHAQGHAGDQRPLPGIASHLQQQELSQAAAPIHGVSQTAAHSDAKSDGRDADPRAAPQSMYSMQSHQPLVPASSELQHQQLRAGEYAGRQPTPPPHGMPPFGHDSAPKLLSGHAGKPDDAETKPNDGVPTSEPLNARIGHGSSAMDIAPHDAQQGALPDSHLHQQKMVGDASREVTRSDIVPQSQMEHPAYSHGAQPGVAHAAHSIQHRDGALHSQSGVGQDADNLHRTVRDQNHVRTEQHLGMQSIAKQEPAAIGQQSEQMQASQDQAGASSDPSGARRGQLKVEDALAYLEKVKTQFGDKLEVYNLFLDIMKAFKAQTIDTTEVIVRVSQLFMGHASLILGFNRFLPPGYKIQIVEDEKTGAVVSTGFEGPKGYSSLSAQQNLDLKPIPQPKPPKRKQASGASSPKRKESKSKTVPGAAAGSASDVVMTPAEPEAGAPQEEGEERPPSPAPSADAMHDVNEPRASTKKSIAAAGPSSALPPKGSGQASGRAKTSTGVAAGVPSGTVAVPLGATDDERVKGFEKAISFVKSVKSRVTSSPDLFVRFMAIFSDFRQEQKTTRELYDSVAELFVAHKDLLQEFKEFLPMLNNVNAANGTKAKASANANASKQKPTGRRTTSTSSRLPFLNRSKSPRSELAIFDYIKEKLGPHNKHIYNDFIKCISLLTNDILTKDELLLVSADLFKNCPAAQDAFTEYLEAAAFGELGDDDDDSSSDESDIEPPTAEELIRYHTRPVSETAADSKVMGTKSYRGLPRNFPKFACSGRSSLEKVTLNTTWVSVTQGSEEYSAKFMRKNSYEDNLYRCEDDRYELDMVIETNAATIMQLEPIALTMTKLPSEIKPMHALVEGALNRIHYNAIQRIYGEQGQEVVMQVKLNPSVTIPVVLARLKEKDLHWRRARNEMNRIWRDVGEKNYYKGVDHRSTVYKAFDKKELSSKILLHDILDPVASENLRETELARARGFAIPAGCGVVNDRSRAVCAVTKAMKNSSPGSLPTLELEYKDDTIHRNAFDLIRMTILKENNDTTTAKSTFRCLRKLITSFYGVSFEDDDAGARAGPSVLYGDEAVYIMFRLYDYLYERLAMARAGAMKLAKDQARRNEMDIKGRARVEGKTHIPKLANSPSSLVRSFSPTASHKHFSVKKLSTSGQELFDEFLKMFKALLNGKEDATKFEDRCRVILGPMSFVVFTLDKLVLKTVRQVGTVCASETVSRAFLDLYQESRSRTKSAPKNADDAYWEGMEALYCTAATGHLRKEKGEKANLFRMQYVKKKVNGGLLVIHAFGKTTTEEEEKTRASDAAELDAFVGFNASADVAVAKIRKGGSNSRGDSGQDAAGNGSRNGGGDRTKNGNGNGGAASGSKSARAEKRKAASQSGQAVRKRSRSSVGSRPMFLPGHVVMEKVQDKDLVIRNGLQIKINSSGQMVYVDGGSDVLLNRGRTWKRPDPQECNEKSKRAKKVKKMLGIDETERKKELAEASKDAKMDVDSTESSSGDASSGSDGEAEEKAKNADVGGDAKKSPDVEKSVDAEKSAGREEKTAGPADDVGDEAGETASDSTPKESVEDVAVAPVDEKDVDEKDVREKDSKDEMDVEREDHPQEKNSVVAPGQAESGDVEMNDTIVTGSEKEHREADQKT